MIQPDPIFLGVVPRGARRYVAREIVRLGKPFFAGRFSVIEAAVQQDSPPPDSTPPTSGCSHPSSATSLTNRRASKISASAFSTPTWSRETLGTNSTSRPTPSLTAESEFSASHVALRRPQSMKITR